IRGRMYHGAPVDPRRGRGAMPLLDRRARRHRERHGSCETRRRMVAVRAETFHPLAAFSDDTPTTRPDSRAAPQPPGAGLTPRDPATLTFVEGPLAGAIIPMAPGSSLLLGRGASANVRIPEDTVSREHARIRWDGSGYVIEDRGSTGTWVNGWRVDSWRP